MNICSKYINQYFTIKHVFFTNTFLKNQWNFFYQFYLLLAPLCAVSILFINFLCGYWFFINKRSLLHRFINESSGVISGEHGGHWIIQFVHSTHVGKIIITNNMITITWNLKIKYLGLFHNKTNFISLSISITWSCSEK